jgi:hypothetical protein
MGLSLSKKSVIVSVDNTSTNTTKKINVIISKRMTVSKLKSEIAKKTNFDLKYIRITEPLIESNQEEFRIVSFIKNIDEIKAVYNRPSSSMGSSSISKKLSSSPGIIIINFFFYHFYY